MRMLDVSEQTTRIYDTVAESMVPRISNTPLHPILVAMKTWNNRGIEALGAYERIAEESLRMHRQATVHALRSSRTATATAVHV